jgi:hypothetical protein
LLPSADGVTGDGRAVENIDIAAEKLIGDILVMSSGSSLLMLNS